MGTFEALYSKVPVWAQHGLVSAYGLYWHWLRFRGGYHTALDEYRRRECLTADEWRRWQRERLATLLAVAGRDVPYYRRHWSDAAKAAAAAGRLDDLPLLEKDAVRAEIPRTRSGKFEAVVSLVADRRS